MPPRDPTLADIRRKMTPGTKVVITYQALANIRLNLLDRIGVINSCGRTAFSVQYEKRAFDYSWPPRSRINVHKDGNGFDFLGHRGQITTTYSILTPKAEELSNVA